MPPERETIEDDTLRLIFTCCHPVLPVDAQIALTLREVCGLTTEEVAAAFLAKPTAIAQRIVRAKARIREAALPYEVPPPAEWPDRLDAVLHTIYLIFNEGYEASSGDALIRQELSLEAIRLDEHALHSGDVIAGVDPQPDRLRRGAGVDGAGRHPERRHGRRRVVGAGADPERRRPGAGPE